MSFHIIKTVILHTKGSYRNSGIRQKKATEMKYSVFGMKQWSLSCTNENNRNSLQPLTVLEHLVHVKVPLVAF